MVIEKNNKRGCADTSFLHTEKGVRKSEKGVRAKKGRKSEKGYGDNDNHQSP